MGVSQIPHNRINVIILIQVNEVAYIMGWYIDINCTQPNRQMVIHLSSCTQSISSGIISFRYVGWFKQYRWILSHSAFASLQNIDDFNFCRWWFDRNLVADMQNISWMNYDKNIGITTDPWYIVFRWIGTKLGFLWIFNRQILEKPAMNLACISNHVHISQWVAISHHHH